jgi:hypothetical protein
MRLGYKMDACGFNLIDVPQIRKGMKLLLFQRKTTTSAAELTLARWLNGRGLRGDEYANRRL